jgi:hypothetical protein
MAKKVPAEIAKNIAYVKSPKLVIAHPIAIATTFNPACPNIR